MQSENQRFEANIALFLKEKKCNSEATLFNQLLKLIWECAISLSARAFKNGQKWAKVLDNKFDLPPCIIIHFPSISKNNSIFFNGQICWSKVKERWKIIPPNINSWIIFLFVLFCYFSKHQRNFTIVTSYRSPCRKV